MFVLVTYDVQTTTVAGRKRLRAAARICLDYGQRVQNSVFELQVDPQKWAECRHRLLAAVDPDSDSVRFYFLGANWQRRVEHAGRNRAIDFDGPLIE